MNVTIESGGGAPANHWPFVVWMIGFPLANDVADYLQFLAGKHYPEEVTGLAAIATGVIWGVVGLKLWRDRFSRA